MKTVLLTLLAAAVLGLAVAAVVVWRGLYDVSATSAHTRPVYNALEKAMHQSVRLRAADIQVPALDKPGLVQRGAACFRDWCVQCHGAPGVGPGPVGLSLQPLPGSLVDAARRWKAHEIYWITRYGIKMSGMPAWEYRLSEQDIWAVTAFLARLSAMSPRDYRAIERSVEPQQCTTVQGACARPPCPAPTRAAAIDSAGRVPDTPTLFRQYACTACHVIPGVSGSSIHVGPPLDGLTRRARIGGKLPNTEEDLVRFIRFPQDVDPDTAMPDLGVTQAHARQMARYLRDAR